jgi:CBS-domain-containing membrane protein
MTERNLHALPVVDDAGILLGVLLASDVMQDLLHVVRNLPPASEAESLSP